MIEIERDTLHVLLQMDVLTVTFEKKDGCERVMKCTLREDLLPPVVIKEGTEKKVRKVNEDVMAVFDLEANAFRSFRMDSIKNIESSPGDPNG